MTQTNTTQNKEELEQWIKTWLPDNIDALTLDMDSRSAKQRLRDLFDKSILQAHQSGIEEVRGLLLKEGYLKSLEQIGREDVKSHCGCCWCKDCGHWNDECVCESNELNKKIKSLKENKQ